jgi:hypothetical protein
MLRLGFATLCVATGLLWSGVVLAAQTPVEPGRKATLDIEIMIEGKFSSQGEAGQSTEWRVLRQLQLSYELVAGKLSPASVTDAQVQAQQTEQGTALAQQGDQAMANNANLMAQMQAAVEACGDDEACVEAYAMKLSQDPQLQQMSKDSAQMGQSMESYNQANPPRFQQWNVQSPKPLAGAYKIEEWRKDVVYDPICGATANLCTTTRERKVEAKIGPDDQTAGGSPTVEVDMLQDKISVVLTHPLFIPTIPQVTQDGPGEAQVRFLPYSDSDYLPALKYLAVPLKGSFADQKGNGSVKFSELEDYRGPLKLSVRWHFHLL